MIEGWHDDTYLIIFEEQADALAMTERYGLPEMLPGFTVAGLREWDDLIVRDAGGQFFTVPTVPITGENLQRYDFDLDLASLEADGQMRGKIKWYVTPLIFGGDPSDSENTAWITLEQHVAAVRWWNAKYREIIAEQVSASDGDKPSN